MHSHWRKFINAKPKSFAYFWPDKSSCREIFSDCNSLLISNLAEKNISNSNQKFICFGVNILPTELMVAFTLTTPVESFLHCFSRACEIARLACTCVYVPY